MSTSDELYASYENGREAGIASAREAFDAERAAYESKIIEIEARRVDDAEIIATLEAENAKLRDLLRRVLKIDEEAQSAEDVDDALMELCNEIKSAIEPSGDGGEEHPKDMLADIDQEELRP